MKQFNKKEICIIQTAVINLCNELILNKDNISSKYNFNKTDVENIMRYFNADKDIISIPSDEYVNHLRAMAYD